MYKQLFSKLTTPVPLNSLIANVIIAIPRIICGLLLMLDFGSGKFGMPSSDSKSLYVMVLGSGRIGLDYVWARRFILGRS